MLTCRLMLTSACLALALLVSAGCQNEKPMAQHDAMSNAAATASTSAKTAVVASGPISPNLKLANTTCPVSGEKLDRSDKSMRVIQYQGKNYGVCCSDCQAKVQKNPAKYLATADKTH